MTARRVGDCAFAVVVDGYSTGHFYPAAIRAKGLGAVHVASGTERQSPGLAAYVDRAMEQMRGEYAALYADWDDFEDLARRLARHTPCCVMAGSEIGVELADRLARRLGLPGNDPATSALRRDKLAMHEALAAAGLPHLASLATDDVAAGLAFAESLGRWPVVVKPLRSAATEGVRFCRTPQELDEALTALLGSVTQFGEQNVRALVQHCAVGREFAVNTVSRNGRHVLSDLWEYHKIPTPGGAPLYDRTQFVPVLGPQHRELLDYAFRTLDVLGVAYGPAHTEIMLTEAGPVLIECGARPMGGSFPPDLLRECLGHTQVEWAVDAYADEAAFAAHLAAPYRPTGSMCMKSLISTRHGALASVPGIALAARLPSARWGNFLGGLESGQVARTVDLLTSAAHIFLCHADAAVVEADWAILRELEIEAQNALFELAPADCGLVYEPDRAARLPDACQPRPEAQGVGAGAVIWQALALSPGERVLDCPCGDGRVGAHLAGRGAVVTGLDSNPRFVARAAARFAAAGLAATALVGDMRRITWRESFDAVVNWPGSFGYLGIEDDFDVLARFAAALRPGGRLLLEAPNRAGLLGALKCRGGSDGNPGGDVWWDEATERLLLPLPAKEPDSGACGAVAGGVRLYSLAQYRLFLRLAGLTLARVHGEGLTEFVEASSRRMLLVAVKPETAGPA